MQTVRSLHLFALSVLYCITLAITLALSPLSALQVALAAVLAVPLIWLSMTDLEKMTIPDSATATIGVTGLLYQFQSDASGLLITLPLAVLLLLILWLAGEAYWRKTNTEALGIGDAKLVAAGTLCVGIENIWLVILTASLGGIIVILIARFSGGAKQSSVPFGPFLAYAIFITFLSNGSP
jgi:prepilin signal peptidase PulO-like enzyme (type II secretory pathway)